MINLSNLSKGVYLSHCLYLIACNEQDSVHSDRHTATTESARCHWFIDL